jgi:hypothetical protein
MEGLRKNDRVRRPWIRFFALPRYTPAAISGGLTSGHGRVITPQPVVRERTLENGAITKISCSFARIATCADVKISVHGNAINVSVAIANTEKVPLFPVIA